MKYLFITLKVQDGENTHTHRVLTTCYDHDNILQAADGYVSDYYDQADEKRDGWYYFHDGTIAAKVENVELLTEYEYKLMSKIFSGEARPGYFNIVQKGYEAGLQREELEVNCGENGKMMIYKTPEGFIVDVYSQDDEVDTMTIWEDDLTPMPDEYETDDDGNCKYCGEKCWEGEMCDEQQAGGFNNPTEDEIDAYLAYWGQSQGEITSNLGYSESHEESDDLLMEDYFFLEGRKEWYPKLSRMYTEKDQQVADYVRNNRDNY